ncbi:hypothetical protein KIL84_008735 [Mauremys mutica]|uniref:Uncharacterized protein n=1 Tax=Mauremys mutica TaxID=74926 RepID=A0A9D3X3G1_9SAUR|nr:hypothetical protein KIL84_008735 [Mauremys mutica]
MENLLMGVKLELTRQVNHPKTDPVDIEGVHQVAEAFSVEAEVEGAVASLEEVETEAMEEADSIPEVGDIMGLETTIAAAGIKVAMVTGHQEGPTETTMTVTLHTTSKNPS